MPRWHERGGSEAPRRKPPRRRQSRQARRGSDRRPASRRPQRRRRRRSRRALASRGRGQLEIGERDPAPLASLTDLCQLIPTVSSLAHRAKRSCLRVTRRRLLWTTRRSAAHRQAECRSPMKGGVRAETPTAAAPDDLRVRQARVDSRLLASAKQEPTARYRDARTTSTAAANPSGRSSSLGDEEAAASIAQLRRPDGFRRRTVPAARRTTRR